MPQHHQRWPIGITLVVAIAFVGTTTAGPIPLAFDRSGYFALSPDIGSRLGKVSAGDLQGSALPGIDYVDPPHDPRRNFTTSTAVTGRVRSDILRQATQARGAEAAHELEAVLTKEDLIGQFDHALAAFGYSSHDIADVLAAYLVMSWEVVTGNATSTAQLGGANRQIRAWLARDERLLGMSNDDKQALAERMIYAASVSSASKNELSRRQDAVRLASLRQEVRDSVKSFGLDLGSVRLSDRGFTVD
jgi:hypothetical protein